MPGPILWGANDTSNSLQSQLLLKSGALINADGVKNYASNGTLGSGTLSGFTTANVGTLTNGLPTAAPTFGGGLGGGGTLSVAAGNVISNLSQYYLSFAFSTNFQQSSGVAIGPITVDSEDRAQVLQFKQSYTATLGGNLLNFSGTSLNSLAVAFWDATNSVWLSSSGNFNYVQSSGVGHASATVQTGVTTATMYAIVYIPVTSIGASSVAMGSFFLGPQTQSTGPAMTDWVSYTPVITNSTGALTNYTASAMWKQLGDTYLVEGAITFTGTSGAFQGINVAMPNNGSIDYTKLGSSQWNVVGSTSSLDSGVLGYGIGDVIAGGANTVGLFYNSQNTSTGPAVSIGFSNTGPFTFSTSDVITFEFKVPIVGKSSNTAMSADSQTRINSSKISVPTLTITAGAQTQVPFTTASALYDKTGMVGTNQFTATSTGIYSLKLKASNNIAGTDYCAIYYSINGGTKVLLDVSLASSQSLAVASGGDDFPLNSGDTVQVYVQEGTGTTAINIMASLTQSLGPAVVQATESVNASYNNVSGQSIGANTTTQVVGWTKEYDSHNAFNTSTSLYTAPVTGTYLVHYQTAFGVANSSSHAAQIYKNATAYNGNVSGGMVANGFVGQSSGAFDAFKITKQLKLSAGDTISLGAFNGAAGAAALSSDPTIHYFSIARIGN